MKILMFLLLFIENEIVSPFYNRPEFWGILSLIVVFVIDTFRQSIARKRDKKDVADKEAKIEKELKIAEKKAHGEREANAAKIRKDLEKAAITASSARKEDSKRVIEKLEEQHEVIKDIVTVPTATEHKEELKEAIDEGAKKADAAYEMAQKKNGSVEKKEADKDVNN